MYNWASALTVTYGAKYSFEGEAGYPATGLQKSALYNIERSIIALGKASASKRLLYIPGAPAGKAEYGWVTDNSSNPVFFDPFPAEFINPLVYDYGFILSLVFTFSS